MSITSTSTRRPADGVPMTDPVLTPRARLRDQTMVVDCGQVLDRER